MLACMESLSPRRHGQAMICSLSLDAVLCGGLPVETQSAPGGAIELLHLDVLPGQWPSMRNFCLNRDVTLACPWCR
jgi:hypothetical protein